MKFYRKLPENISQGRKEYIENGIAAHCTFHINSLMMCEESKENKKKIIECDKKVKRTSVQIYNDMNKMSRTVVMLRRTFYLSYTFLQRYKEKITNN